MLLLRPAERIISSLRELLHCRLCWRIALAVFALILVVESAILIPSAQRFEQTELDRLADHAVIAIEPVLQIGGAVGGSSAPLAPVTAMIGQYGLAGLAMYDRNGRALLRAGDHLGLAYAESVSQSAGMMARMVSRSADGRRTDIAWRSGRADEPLVIARLDSSHLKGELLDYLMRVAGLVLIIVLVVTSGTMLVLHRVVLRDLLRLRSSAAAAALDPSHSSDYSVRVSRGDELGEVLRAFDLLLERVGSRTSQLERANRDLDSFGYSVSHDLRAPLAAISGFAYLLGKQESARLSEDGANMCAKIEKSAERMSLMLDRLLEFSRLAEAPLAKRAVVTAPLVHELIEEIRGTAGPRALQFQVGALPDCNGDPVLLGQVWSNLLRNAVKYSRNRDPAVVRVGFDAAAQAYEVRDNGAGFDMSRAERLFGVFERLHGEKEFEGTGVGLAIAKRIVEKHGGRIWAEAAPGTGATFRFTLQGIAQP